MPRKRYARYAEILLLLIPLIYFLRFEQYAGRVDSGDDTPAYYLAAKAIQDGESMYKYQPPPGPHRFTGPHYLYPPPFAAILSHLPLEDVAQLSDILLWLNALGLWGIAFGLTRCLGYRGYVPTALVALALLLVPVITFPVAIGNVQPLITGLIATAFAISAGPAAGLLFAAAALKVTPAWALGVLLVREGKPAWYGFAVAGAVCLFLTLAAVPPARLATETLNWLAHAAPSLSQGQFEVGAVSIGGQDYSGRFFVGNISPMFLLTEAFLEEPPVGETLPLWARAYLAIMQLGVPALTLVLTRGRPAREQSAWVLAAATLSAPILRGSYIPIVLIAPALLVGNRRTRLARETRGRREMVAQSNRVQNVPTVIA